MIDSIRIETMTVPLPLLQNTVDKWWTWWTLWWTPRKLFVNSLKLALAYATPSTQMDFFLAFALL